jgi:sugar-specific transcriptional regulator TrmB
VNERSLAEIQVAQTNLTSVFYNFEQMTQFLESSKSALLEARATSNQKDDPSYAEFVIAINRIAGAVEYLSEILNDTQLTILIARLIRLEQEN